MISSVTLFFIIFINLHLVVSHLTWNPGAIAQFSIGITSLVESPDIGGRRSFVNLGLMANFPILSSSYNFFHRPQWPGIARKKRHSDNSTVINHHKQATMGHDISAGAFYRILRELTVEQGYHEKCLERAICEMAENSLHVHKDDVFSELMEFFFTPSLHDCFSENETKEKGYFEEVERKGREDHNCSLVYPECEKSFLDHFTDVIHDENL